MGPRPRALVSCGYNANNPQVNGQVMDTGLRFNKIVGRCFLLWLILRGGLLAGQNHTQNDYDFRPLPGTNPQTVMGRDRIVNSSQEQREREANRPTPDMLRGEQSRGLVYQQENIEEPP